MISGGDEDSSEDDESSGAVSQWSLIARAPKVLGVDPVTQLQVHRYSYVFTSTFNSGTTYNSTQCNFTVLYRLPMGLDREYVPLLYIVLIEALVQRF